MLVEHAKRELELIGEDDEVIKDYLKVIEAFASAGHSGFSASVAIEVITKLLKFENLSPLTNDSEEWNIISKDNKVWQSRRNPQAFSKDGGKTYYLLSEIKSASNPEIFHVSKEK